MDIETVWWDRFGRIRCKAWAGLYMYTYERTRPTAISVLNRDLRTSGINEEYQFEALQLSLDTRLNATQRCSVPGSVHRNCFPRTGFHVKLRRHTGIMIDGFIPLGSQDLHLLHDV